MSEFLYETGIAGRFEARSSDGSLWWLSFSTDLPTADLARKTQEDYGLTPSQQVENATILMDLTLQHGTERFLIFDPRSEEAEPLPFPAESEEERIKIRPELHVEGNVCLSALSREVLLRYFYLHPTYNIDAILTSATTSFARAYRALKEKKEVYAAKGDVFNGINLKGLMGGGTTAN